MLNSIIAFKDSVIKKFGPVLGYAVLIIGAIAAISVLCFVLRTLFTIAIVLAIAGLIVFGIYKLMEICKGHKADNKQP